MKTALIPLASIHLALTILSLVAISFAGCAGGAKGAPVSSTTGAAAAIVSEDTGSIQGLVIDDQVVPLAGVDVGIMETGQVTKSDADGQFTLNGVVPGPHTLAANRLGYESLSQRVEIVAGEVTEARITLVPLAVEEPFHDSIPFSGQFQCSVAAIDIVWLDCPTESKSSFYFQKPEGVRHLVGELQWTSASAGTGQNLDFNLVKGTSAEDTHDEQWYANVFGASPLVMRVTVGEQFENAASPAAVGSSDQDRVVDDEDTNLGFNIYSSPTYVEDQALVGLTIEQTFDGYVTLFYDMDVPEGFSAFADG